MWRNITTIDMQICACLQLSPWFHGTGFTRNEICKCHFWTAEPDFPSGIDSIEINGQQECCVDEVHIFSLAWRELTLNCQHPYVAGFWIWQGLLSAFIYSFSD